MITVASTSDSQKDAQAAADAFPPQGAPAKTAPSNNGTESAGASETPEPVEQQEREKEGKEETVSDRIRELTYRRREAERRQFEAEERARRAEAQIRAPQPAPTTSTAKADGEPDPNSFETYDQYTRAQIRYEVKQAEKARIEQEAQQKQMAERQTMVDSWNSRLAAGRKEYADFDEVVGKPEIPVSPTMTIAMVESERGADLAYWFGKNPDEARRIAGLSPYAAAREIAKIEDSFTSKTPPAEQKPIASAPEPIRPVGGSKTHSNRDPGSMTFAEYKRWRNAGGGR